MSGPDPVLGSLLEKASVAAQQMADCTLPERARWLRTIADALDEHGGDLVELAAAETHLATQRLTGELARTSFQLRLTAEAILEGSWLEATIDLADPDWPMGARPDLRRILRPLGPVLIVAASNFPFAFSVAGGDTATALGAGCPVICKAHPGHLELSRRTARLTIDALDRAGAPSGAFALIEDEADARAAISDTRIKAGAFTGSESGGRAFFDLATGRPDPIPFYGELGSVNPVFVLPSALTHRRQEILEGFVGSYLLGAGQFCTKPGVIFLPRQAATLADLTALVRAVKPGPLLNDMIMNGLKGRLGTMHADWETLVEGTAGADGVSASLFATTADKAADKIAILFEETFGPAAVVVEYDSTAQLVAIARQLPAQLTATVHGELDDPDADSDALLSLLSSKAGRIVWNSWPTGVSVTWAMQHGGSWPATTASVHTSVGPTALRRFLTPVAFQDLPEALLPALLRDDTTSIWRRINGQLTPPQEQESEAGLEMKQP